MKRRYKISLWVVGSLCAICLALWIAVVIWYLQSGASVGTLVGDVTTGHSSTWVVPEGITYVYVMDTKFGKRRLAVSQAPLMALAISSASGIDFSVAKPKRLIATWSRLLDAGQPIDSPVPDANGLTALEIAALTGRPELVRFLLVHGANPNHAQLLYWPSDKKRTKVAVLDKTLCAARSFPRRDYEPVIQLLVDSIKSRGAKLDLEAARRFAQHCHPWPIDNGQKGHEVPHGR